MHFYTLDLLLLILVSLIAISAFFSSSEIGMMSLNRYRLRHLAKKGNRNAIRVAKLLERPDRLLSVILIGNTFANIFASAIATVIAVRLYGDLGIAIATFLLTLVILIFAEIAPKTVAALYPQQVAFIVSWPLKILQIVFYPLVWLGNTIANAVLRLVGIKLHKGVADHLSSEELRSVVHEAGVLIPHRHREMLISILDLENVTVEDIMIARSDIVGVDLQDPWEDILEQLENSQHTRLPLFDGDINQIKGLIHMRKIVSLLLAKELTPEILIDAAEEPYFIPEGTSLNTQLLNFQRAKARRGFVVDEYGDIQGLATLEDILEEIVGEFTTDIAAVSKDINSQEDGSVLVEGSVFIRDVNREMGWQLPTDGPKTISGLITEYLEFIPPVGTCMHIANYTIEVVQVKDNAVKTARVVGL